MYLTFKMYLGFVFACIDLLKLQSLQFFFPCRSMSVVRIFSTENDGIYRNHEEQFQSQLVQLAHYGFVQATVLTLVNTFRSDKILLGKGIYSCVS